MIAPPRESREAELAPVRRWTAYRKWRLLRAVRAGVITASEAMTTHSISADEMKAWERVLQRQGPEGLMAKAVMSRKGGADGRA